MEYSATEAERVEALFKAFRVEHVTFVIPRGYQDLPNSVPGGDIDIYVHQGDFATAVRVAETQGFERERSSRSRLTTLVTKPLENPVQTCSVLLSNQRKLLRFVHRQFQPEESVDSHGSQYMAWESWNRSIKLHLMNHLAYESPMNGNMIRTHPAVEDALFEHARERDGLFVPAPPDELAHLLCRGVFSKEGEFPTYYVTRCEELSRVILNSNDMYSRFEKLLQLLFFDADEVVINAVHRGEYQTLRDNLFSFSDY